MSISKAVLIFLAITFPLQAWSKDSERLAPLSSADLGVDIDYREQGEHAFSITQGSMRSSYGCELEYTFFQAQANNEISAKDEGKKIATVILAHGFFRSQKNVREMAEHVASWGVPIVTVSLCNSRPWNGYHDRNGEDMVALVEELNLNKVIYSGFSAGGLAALLATSQDQRALAYLGLDMVDNFDKGLIAVENIQADMFALVAKPSQCNAKNNGLAVYDRARKKQVIGLAGATHCDFEFPYDGRCKWVCGRTKKPYDRNDIQSTILGLTTALFVWKSHTDERAKLWWDKTSSVMTGLEKHQRLYGIER